MIAARPATPARPRAPTVAMGIAAPVALDAAEDALPAAALVALATREDAELAIEEAEASAEEAPPLAADDADEAAPETELAAEEAEALAPDAAEEARLETLDAPEEAEPCNELATNSRTCMFKVLTPTPPAPKMVLAPVAVVNVLPAESVPVEKRVSVETGVEPPLPAAPPAKIVDSLTAVVNVLPALLVPVLKMVSVEMGVAEPPLPDPDCDAPPAGLPVAVKAEVAERVPTELPALDAEAAARSNQYVVQHRGHG